MYKILQINEEKKDKLIFIKKYKRLEWALLKQITSKWPINVWNGAQLH